MNRTLSRHDGKPTTNKPENWDEVLALWRGGEITINEARRRLKMTKKAFYKELKESYDK